MLFISWLVVISMNFDLDNFVDDNLLVDWIVDKCVLESLDSVPAQCNRLPHASQFFTKYLCKLLLWVIDLKISRQSESFDWNNIISFDSIVLVKNNKLIKIGLWVLLDYHMDFWEFSVCLLVIQFKRSNCLVRFQKFTVSFPYDKHSHPFLNNNRCIYLVSLGKVFFVKLFNSYLLGLRFLAWQDDWRVVFITFIFLFTNHKTSLF